MAFGFPVSTAVTAEPEIPFPTAADSILGGQAVTAVGYDDKARIRSDKGATLGAKLMGQRLGRSRLRLATVRFRTRATGVRFLDAC